MSSTDEEIQVLDEDILDVDLLITLVEENPLLWDKTLDSYSDRNEKRKCWKDMFCKIKPGFEEMDIKDQKIIGVVIFEILKYYKKKKNTEFKIIEHKLLLLNYYNVITK
ncbi:hypothetical protein QTP88_019728 [Uroleucon formosanum]